jgi:3-carboxy-cis,cis-muconate cycloisomerase
MSSSRADDGLFAGVFAHGAVTPLVDDRALLQAMLDFEAALIQALISRGLAPSGASEGLAAMPAADALDLAALGRSTGEQGTPVPGLLAQIRPHLPEVTRAHLHRGATSQDVLDTALMLVAARALAALRGDLDRAAVACAALAAGHGATVMAGRTLLQQALPTSFALKAAGWLDGLTAVRAELAEVRRRGLALQFGGAVGTLAALGTDGLAVAAALGAELELPAPPLPWHTNRTRPARLAAALGTALGAMGKIARDITLLAQTEVAEAAEGGGPGRGGSSTMPHKHNPVGAVAVLACAGQGPGLVAAVLGAMVGEHERAAGAWQAESEPLRALLRLSGSAAASLAQTLEGLEVDPERMRTNLELGGAAMMSESIVTALTPRYGRERAQALVGEATRSDRDLAGALLANPEIAAALGADGIRAALDPAGYLGAAAALVQRALAAHETLERP